MKIALNKTYLTEDKKIFSPKRTRRGNKIFNIKNMLGGTVWTGYYEIIFIDGDGNEYFKYQLKNKLN
ncbi:MAG: hypothetical protein ACJA2M_000323 [Polaribacter sp.]|jgi:hypothetical protein